MTPSLGTTGGIRFEFHFGKKPNMLRKNITPLYIVDKIGYVYVYIYIYYICILCVCILCVCVFILSSYVVQ